MSNFRKSFFAGIFLVAASTLFLEIALTKVFSIIHYYYSAFLIVSTALFGYGFSGILLSVSRRLEKWSPVRLLFGGSMLFSVSIVVSYRLILAIPLRMSGALSDPTQLLYLGIVYLLLSVPFFFSGLIIGVLLSTYTQQINKLYFADLTGAAVGCFAIVVAIPYFGGSGAVVLSALIAGLAALLFAEGMRGRIACLAWCAISVLLVHQADQLFPTILHSEKRYFHDSITNGKHTYTGWSPASRIDVVKLSPDVCVIWIDGGTNQSFMHRLGSTDIPGRDKTRPWKTVELPYALLQNPRAMIIGPGGGVEVQSALGYGPSAIDAVELDPLITKIVLGEYDEYIGRIYRRDNIHLVNEEGRSFIRRSPYKYDIIQQKNNSHPMAVASGALNLSETYLLTKEAFQEYIDHLNPGGFITIERHGGIRLLNLAAEVLKDRGVKEYWKQLMLLEEDAVNQVFLLKNGPFTYEELKFIREYMAKNRDRVLYSPDQYDSSRNVFTRMMHPEDHANVLREAPFQLEAPTDDKPFLEHFFRLSALFSNDAKSKMAMKFWADAALNGFISGDTIYSDLSVYAILVEALLLSSVFIVYPLLKRKRAGLQMKGTTNLLVYFSCLGLGFIFIEISLIQKYILFIGYPVYAVAVILFSLLISAGAGSYFSNRYSEKPFALLRIAVMAIVVLTLAQMFVVPLLFRQFLAVPFSMRLVLSVLFLLPSGFFMGIPFPVGLSWTSKNFEGFVPWAWGMNGYATVIGSVLSVIIALNFGFRIVLLTAILIYILAYVMLRRLTTPVIQSQPFPSPPAPRDTTKSTPANLRQPTTDRAVP